MTVTVEILRDRKVLVQVPLTTGGWVTCKSKISKVETDFWLAGGDWVAVEIYDKERKDWKAIVHRHERKVVN